MLQKNKIGFTIIELLVAISIISIIAVGISNINFSTLSDRQKIEIFKNSIITKYETIRSYAITGKGLGVNLSTPEKWRIEFFNAGTDTIKTYYSFNGTTWLDFDEINFLNYYGISSLECLHYDGSNTSGNITSQNVIIEIDGSNLTLTGACSDPSYKILRSTLRFRNNFEQIIEINTINGLIETL